MGLADAQATGLLEYVDPEPVYLGHMATLVDLEGIRNSGLKVIVDSMFGSGAGYFKELLSGGATQIVELHGERNPAFPGMSQPEPIAQNLGEAYVECPEASCPRGYRKPTATPTAWAWSMRKVGS